MIPRLLTKAPDLIGRLGRYVASDPAAVANARRSMLHEARERRQRDRLAPGSRPDAADGPGGVLEAIEPEQCWQLLATQPIGRLSFTAHSGVPVIVVVNYAVDGQTVVLRTGRGPKLQAAARGELVAFEADDIDPATRTGWSVVVLGKAQVAADPASRRRLAGLGLAPWAAGPRDDYVVIAPRNVAGRRLCPPE